MEDTRDQDVDMETIFYSSIFLPRRWTNANGKKIGADLSSILKIISNSVHYKLVSLKLLELTMTDPPIDFRSIY